MKKIITCASLALILTALTLLVLFCFIKIGLWFFSLDPAIGITILFLIMFTVITFITFFQAFYGNLNYGIFEKYRKYIDGDDDV